MSSSFYYLLSTFAISTLTLVLAHGVLQESVVLLRPRPQPEPRGLPLGWGALGTGGELTIGQSCPQPWAGKVQAGGEPICPGLDKAGTEAVEFSSVGRACSTFIETMKKKKKGTSLVVQWLRFRAPNAGGVGSIPGRGTEIPHATLTRGDGDSWILPTRSTTALPLPVIMPTRGP